MKTNKFYKWLIESPTVYYLYNRGSIIYDLNNKDSDINFLVVVDPEFVLPEEFEEYKTQGYRHRIINYNILCDNCDFIFFTTDEWFQKVMNGDLIAWECACLPKKFIHKEHVKLLMSTNPLQLRKDFEQYLELNFSIANEYFNKFDYKNWKKSLWESIKYIKFVNQIIQNHKIVNLKEANSEYNQLVNNDCIENELIVKLWLDLIKPHIDLLNKSTDGMLKKEREKKIIQNEKK